MRCIEVGLRGALWLTLLVATAARAAPAPFADSFHEFNVELPAELRKLAGHGALSRVAHARVTIAVPPDIDKANEPAVLVISATADPGYSSSRRLMRRYADTALANGWIVVAADPEEDVVFGEDDLALRLALDMAALAIVGRQWPSADKAPLAFGGFSGGAKISGWLAAAFAKQGRTVVGLYLGGINEDTVIPSATQFEVLDATFKRIPVFLQSGEKDEVATPVHHRDIASRLKRAGFANVRIEYFSGRHEVDPAPLAVALRWFREIAEQSAAAQ